MASAKKRTTDKVFITADTLRDAPGPLLGKKALDPKWVYEDKLQAELEAVLSDELKQPGGAANKGAASAGFAVVDLTADGAQSGFDSPRYSGFNDTQPFEVASLAKLLPLYGLFQLRADARWLAKKLAITDITALDKKLHEAYQFRKVPVGKSLLVADLLEFRDGKVQFRWGKDSANELVISDTNLVIAHKGPPLLARLNRVSPENSKGQRKSALGNLATLRGELDTTFDTPDGITFKLRALELMRLMVGWSDDVAAAVLIEALGFEYLWSLTQAAKLFDTSWPKLTAADRKTAPKAGGLVLSADYSWGAWGRVDEAKTMLPANTPLGLHFATARSVAKLFTLLAQHTLIDAGNAKPGTSGNGTLNDDEILMKELMRKDSSFGLRERCPIGEGLGAVKLVSASAPEYVRPNQQQLDYETLTYPMGMSDPAREDDLAVSKLGLFPENTILELNNALLVQATVPRQPAEVPNGEANPRRITFVLVSIAVSTKTSVPVNDHGEKFGKAVTCLLKARYFLDRVDPCS